MAIKFDNVGEYLGRNENLLPYRGSYSMMVWYWDGKITMKWSFYDPPWYFWQFELYHRLEKYGA